VRNLRDSNYHLAQANEPETTAFFNGTLRTGWLQAVLGDRFLPGTPGEDQKGRYAGLLVAQRHGRLDAGSAAGGDPAGQHTHAEQQDGDARDRERIVG
jgi:hypothetical protein